jgi:hypothetical protein
VTRFPAGRTFEQELDERVEWLARWGLDGGLGGVCFELSPTFNRATGASFVRGNNSGEWNTTSPSMQNGNHEAAHEAGHLMGEEEHYR